MAGLLVCAGERPATGLIKQGADDFLVDELMPFSFSGNGEHVVLRIKKQGLSTFEVVDEIRRRTGIPGRDIGFCGLKDKHATTIQWFSVHCPNDEPGSWSMLENERMRVLAVGRHSKKLKRGHHGGNYFRIKIRQLRGDSMRLERRLLEIGAKGVPNYFGPQRFGRRNLEKADALFRGSLKKASRREQSLLLSSVRSRMFNDVLSERVRDGSWNTLQPGDVAVLNKSNSYFRVEAATEELQDRLDGFDIHPSGPLFGEGENPAGQGVRQLESSVFKEYQHWCVGLRKFGLRFQRRSLRIPVVDLQWKLPDEDLLEISFFLYKGGFATSVLNDFLAWGKQAE